MAIDLDGAVALVTGGANGIGAAAARPALRARGRGALVFTSSLAGLTVVPGDPIYAATKHAVVGLAVPSAPRWRRITSP